MNFARVAISAAIISGLSIGYASATPVVATMEVNMRTGPGTDTQIVTLIPSGSVVEAGKCTNGW